MHGAEKKDEGSDSWEKPYIYCLMRFAGSARKSGAQRLAPDRGQARTVFAPSVQGKHLADGDSTGVCWDDLPTQR